MTSSARLAALNTIADALGKPHSTAPASLAQTVTDLAASVRDLRSHVAPSIVDTVLAAHNVHLPD